MLEPIIIAQDVEKWYDNHFHVLKGVTLKVNKQEVVVIMGPSGSGKSTLLGLLTGVLKPDSGHLSLMKQDTANLGASARDRLRADHIGYIFQQLNLR